MMTKRTGIVRFIRTDAPEDDYFSLESVDRPDHYVGDVNGPRGWLERLVGARVTVVETQKQYSVTVDGSEATDSLASIEASLVDARNSLQDERLEKSERFSLMEEEIDTALREVQAWLEEGR